MVFRKSARILAGAATLAIVLAGCGPATPGATRQPDPTPAAAITEENAIDYPVTRRILWQTSFEEEDGLIGRVTSAQNIGEHRTFSGLSGDCVEQILQDRIEATPIGAPDGAIEYLFDTSSVSKYIVRKTPTVVSPVFIMLPLKEDTAVGWYTITSGNDVPTRDPINWTLQASQDGQSWTVLHTVTKHRFEAREQTEKFVFTNENKYRYYKLEITATGGDAYTQIGGFRIGSGTGESDDVSYMETAAVEPAMPFQGGVGQAVFQIDLRQERVVNRYILRSNAASANEDPKAWCFSASKDGVTWQELHRESQGAFAARNYDYRVDLFNSEPYRYYRLTVTAAAIGSVVSLSGIDLGYTPWKAGEPTVKAGPGAGNVWGSVPNKGWTGENALMFAGTHLGSGAARAEALLYDGLNIPLGADSVFSYVMLPDFEGEYDYGYSSQYTALDLVFTDGTRLSELGAEDQYGFGISAAEQGASGVLYTKTWNKVTARVGLAAGKTVKSILAVYEKAANHNAGNTIFRTYFDDVMLADQPQGGQRALADYVNITRGTYPNTSVIAPTRGTGTPLVAVPSGFNQFAPVNNLNSSRVYSYHLAGSARKIYHLSMVHYPNAVLGDYAEYSFMLNTTVNAAEAAAGDISAQARGAVFSHEDEIAKAHYYSVAFREGDTADCRMEVTPTMHAAKLRFTYGEGSRNRSIIFDCPRGYGKLTLNEDGTFSGYTDMYQNWMTGIYGDSGSRRMYFYGYTDQRPESVKTFGKTGVMTFAPSTERVVMTLASSFISPEQAKKNLELEIAEEESFESVACRAKTAWEEIFSRVQVEGAAEDQLTTLYSCLYRIYLWPLTCHENVGSAERPEYAFASPYEGTRQKPVIMSGKMYTGHGVWDNYRNTYQAYALLTPKLAGEFTQGLLEHYRLSGKPPMALVPKNIVMMDATGANIFADMAAKGIRFDYDLALEAALKEANCAAGGRSGMQVYPYRNYMPMNSGSVSSAMEYSLGDYSVSRLAALLGYEDEAEYLLNRSKAYSRHFAQIDGAGWFVNGNQPNRNGWGDSFDPSNWGLFYIESNAWQIAFYATHDIQGMTALYGGKKALEEKLDAMFAAKNVVFYPPDPLWCYVVESRECKTGQYNHGNEPDHAVPYLYDYAGAPYKTQARVRDILRRLYCGAEMGGGYPGDDDTGEMSAWYVLSALGFYPVEMADNHFAIGSPLFQKVTIHTDSDKIITITAHRNSNRNMYIQSLKVNGRDSNRIYLPQSLFAEGGEIEFVMGDQPSDWGCAEDSLPGTCATPAGEAPQMLLDFASDAEKAYRGWENTRALTDDRAAEAAVSAGEQAEITVIPEQAVSARFVTITSAAGNCADGFTLYGSNDGENWTVLEERDGLTFAWDGFLRPFKVRDQTPFSRFRLALRGAAGFSVSEIEIIG